MDKVMEHSHRKRESDAERALRLAEMAPNESLRLELLQLAVRLSAETAEPGHQVSPDE
jgi:hypothetical protein